MNARLPAFGKKLMQDRIAGRAPRSIYVALEWGVARAFPRVVITDDLPIADIDLRCLTGLDCTLAYREKDSSRVPELAQAILAANPRIFNVLATDMPQNTIIKNQSGEVFL